MAYEMKDNSGSLFPNDKKTTDRHPDRKGSAKIDGVDYWVSGWIKQDRNGNPWMSLSFQRKDTPEVRQTDIDPTYPVRKPAAKDMDADSDIPF